MSAAIACVIAAALLTATALCCFRISAWHRQEAAYWHNVAAKVQFNPAQDAVYRPILTWAKANRPSVWQRLHGWQSPRLRMLDAAS